MYAEILDWDPIPDFLIQNNLINIEQLGNNFEIKNFKFFSQYQIVDQNLLSHIQQNFNFDISQSTYYQVILDGIPIHIDVGRKFAYNYLIDSGSSNVFTTWYKDDKETEVYKIKIPEKMA